MMSILFNVIQNSDTGLAIRGFTNNYTKIQTTGELSLLGGAHEWCRCVPSILPIFALLLMFCLEL